MSELKKVATLRIHPGQSLFAVNLNNGDVINLGRPTRVDLQKDMIYRIALNRKSFLRKLEKEGIIVKKSDAAE